MARSQYYQTKHWRDLRKQALVRDGFRCTVRGCTSTADSGRLYVDHILARPSGSDGPTAYDRLSNLRCLCGVHDAQIREDRNGVRKSGGRTLVSGCDVNGVPLDPRHLWHRS